MIAKEVEPRRGSIK